MVGKVWNHLCVVLGEPVWAGPALCSSNYFFGLCHPCQSQLARLWGPWSHSQPVPKPTAIFFFFFFDTCMDKTAVVLTLSLVLGFQIREHDDSLPLTFPCPTSTRPPPALRTVQKLGAILSSATDDPLTLGKLLHCCGPRSLHMSSGFLSECAGLACSLNEIIFIEPKA